MNRRAFVTGLGAVLAAPLAAEAQRDARIPRVGFLSPGKRVPSEHPMLVAITDGLRDNGYVVGRDILVDWQFAENDLNRLPELVAQLIRSRVDVFLCATTTEVIAAKNATSTIPIVMLGTGDPVGLGFANSLARPGGNITGLSPNLVEVGPKRLQLLKELMPKTSKIGVLIPTGNPGAALQLRGLEAAARAARVELYVVDVHTAEGFRKAFEAFSRERVDSVVIIPDPLAWDYRVHISELAIGARLPTIGQDRQFVEAGALMSYGVNETLFWRRSGKFIARILKGAAPGELPIEQPTNFVLAINTKTAKALGLTIPRSLLLRADSVIE